MYYSFLAGYVILEYIKNGVIAETLWDIAAHFFFLNWATPSLFFSFAAGSGYIGILVLMWILYPLYLRKINSFEKAFVLGMAIISICFIAYRCFVLLNGYAYKMPTATWEPWLWYLWRGVYSYVFGGILFYAIKENVFHAVSNRERKICIVLCLAVLVERMFEVGSLFNGVLFCSICLVLFVLMHENYTIKNGILIFFGKYSIELFASHILAKYVMDVLGVLAMGRRGFVYLWGLSFVLVLPVKLVSHVFSIPLKKIHNKLLKVISQSYEQKM